MTTRTDTSEGLALEVKPSQRLKPFRRTWSERFIVSLLRVFAFSSIAVTLAIVFILFTESIAFFEEVSFREFLFGTRWTPLLEPRSFGVIPIVWGTLFVAFGAMCIAVPFGLLIAIYMSEYASDRVRKVIKPVLELLAGIPSVVFGYFALVAITPFLQAIFPGVQVFNAASAAIVVGIMTLPLVASISDDCIRAVPTSFKESGYAVGATRHEVIFSIVLPAAISGIIASFILAFARAIGETMAVTLAAGATPQMTMSPFESIQTITAYIVQVSLGDTPHGTIEYQSLFAAAIVLFTLVAGVNWVARMVVKRLERKYE